MISLLLGAPFMILFSLLVLGIEPHFGPLDPLLSAGGGRAGSLVFLGTAVLLVAAIYVSLAPVVRGLRAGEGILAHPAALLLAAVALSYLVAFVAAIIIDQYPCWIGVPNCD